MTNFNNKEYLYHPVPGETTRQTVERNYYKYVAPQNQTPTPWSYNTAQPQNNNVKPRYWESGTDGKKVYDDVVKHEGNFTPQRQNIFDYITSAAQGGVNLVGNFTEMKKMNVTDKYKHAMMNCNAAQYGQGGADVARTASNLREWFDKITGANNLDNSEGDQYANRIGRLLGGKYPNEDCDEIIQQYIKKKY